VNGAYLQMRRQLKNLYKEDLPKPVSLSGLPTSFLFKEGPTDEMIRLATRWVGAGLHAEIACRAIGITASQYRAWRDRGVEEIEDGNSQFAKFIRALDIAEAQSEIADVSLIKLGARHGGNLFSLLERRFPHRWGAKQQILVGGVVEQADRKDEIIPQSPEEAGAILAILQAVGQLPAPAAPEEKTGETITVEAEAVSAEKVVV